MIKSKIYDFENHYTSLRLLELMSKREEVPVYDPAERKIFSDANKEFGLYVSEQRTDLGEGRLGDMDRAGLDVAVLSPTVEPELMRPVKSSIEASAVSNLELYKAAKKVRDRFKGMAILPVQNVEASILELEKCKKEYGFIGWMTFSNYGNSALDDEAYSPLLKKAADSGMFIYIHPTVPVFHRVFGCGGAMPGAAYGFSVDVSATVFRMIYKGIFDQLPNLKVMIGHLGEGIPFYIERTDAHSGKGAPGGGGHNSHSPSYYFHHNIWMTTSGSFSKPAFECARAVFGIERMLFGTDYPMESLDASIAFIKSVSMTEIERERIYYKNAEEFLG